MRESVFDAESQRPGSRRCAHRVVLPHVMAAPLSGIGRCGRVIRPRGPNARLKQKSFDTTIPPMRLLLWDIDLTLIRTGGAGIRGLNRAFGEVFGWPNAMEQVAPQGKTDPAIIREVCVKHGLSVESEIVSTVRAILGRYVCYLKEEVESTASYQILPGVVDILGLLDGRLDVALGLATGNIEEGARIKLERGCLNRYFPFGGFGGISEHRVDVVREAVRRAEQWTGRAFSPKDTFVIGDTPNDVAAGREAGLRTVAVATGSFSYEELAAWAPDLLIADFVSGQSQFMRSTRMV
jgi:phosphoglycolate phosphatase-like HAD superfamily hydrolase